MHTLITFLGRGRDNPQTGYRTARYRFDDGHEVETPYFGLALARHLRPDRVIVLGTASSMWDIFVEHLAVADTDEEARLTLMEHVSKGSVDEALLERMTGLLSRAIGCAVQPHLIGMARNADEQNDILAVIAEHAGKGTVSLDLTHGFRHLGMLGFLSAFMLERTAPQRVKIDGLWYAALDMMHDGCAPVLRLDGLQDIQRWIDALNRFDANGNYGVFAPLLENDGMPADKANCLRDAAFRESTLNIKGAREKLLTALKALDTPLGGASRLFQKRLKEQLAWAHEDQYSQFQRILAMRALYRRDYLRAASLGLEALVSRHCEDIGSDPLAFSARDSIRKTLVENSDKDWQRAAYFALNTLRNAMVHGIPPKAHHKIKLPDGKWGKAASVLQNEDLLAKVLRSSLDRLINHKPAARTIPATTASMPAEPGPFAVLADSPGQDGSRSD